MSQNSSNSKFLVVAPPRGGFTLLLSILSIFYRDRNIQKDHAQTLVNYFMPVAAEYVDAVMVNYFKKHIDLKDLFYSKEFKILVGGPKWMDQDDKTVCVRKYLGVKGMGDFTFIQYLPKFTMDFDDVIHSHSHPGRWTEDPYYREYLKFSSTRNPIDIIHSSVYSINALTSEYIQRCITDKESDIRLELALNKLTNPEFIEGLIKFLKNYLDEFIPVKDRFLYVMKWEDLILDPEKTIIAIAKAAGMEISREYAARVWKEIDHRNLTRYHKHSFRRGLKDDWKNSITNTHLEIFKKHGFDEYLEKLGYPKIEFFDESKYTPVQKTIEEHIKRGEVYKYRGDEDLYTFAFNKTNFLATGKYQFKTYPRNGGIKIEKSMFRNEPLILGFIETMGPALSFVSDFLEDLWGAAKESVKGNGKKFVEVAEKYREGFARELDQEKMDLYAQAFESVGYLRAAEDIPICLESYRSYNIVMMRGCYYGVPQDLGPMDLQKIELSAFPSILSGDTVNAVKELIGAGGRP